MSSFPPGLLLILGALPIALLRGRARAALVLGLPLVALALVWLYPADFGWSTHFLGYTLTPLRVTTLGRVFATVFGLMAFVGGLFALRQARTLELAAAFFYAGGAVSVTFAGDLVTLFVFWELMAVGSTLVIWAAGTREAYAASMRYLMVHLFGGVLLMFGIAAPRAPDRLAGPHAALAPQRRELCSSSSASSSTPARRRSPPGSPTPTRRPARAAPSSSPPTPPRPRSTRCSPSSPAPGC